MATLTSEKPDVDWEKQFTSVDISDPESNRSSRASGSSTQQNSAPEPDIEKGNKNVLPPKRHGRIFRHTRHTFLNVYRRLFSLVFLFNIIGLAGLLSKHHNWTSSPPLTDFATAASANIMVALLVRQDYVINTFFRMCWLIPMSAPLRLRCMLAKVYEYGGVHSGASVSSIMWFFFLTGCLTHEFVAGRLGDAAIISFSYILLAMLMALSITAYPALRFKSHNTFENVHRLGGWFSLALFWVELVLVAKSDAQQEKSADIASVLFKYPATYFLLISSLHAIYPWLRFHKLHVTPQKLSDHAVRLHFTERIPTFVGLRISHAPLKEWHSFAAIPSRDGGKSGGSILISNAGDWTKDTIQNPRPYYYVKGRPVTGVLCLAQIFRSVVIVSKLTSLCISPRADKRNTC